MQNNSLSGRTAVVTGASSGIGKAIADKLLENNAVVVNADIEAPAMETGNERYLFCRTDVSLKEDVERLYNKISGKNYKPDLLVCNAGRGIHEKLSEGDPEKWVRVINTNLVGTLRILRSFLPGLLAGGNADIVIVSSVAAAQPYEYGGIYSATKAALQMIAETLRLELKDRVRVTTIAPGVVDTKFFQHMGNDAQSVESIGQGALMAEDVADAVLYALKTGKNKMINHITIRNVRQQF